MNLIFLLRNHTNKFTNNNPTRCLSNFNNKRRPF